MMTRYQVRIKTRVELCRSDKAERVRPATMINLSDMLRFVRPTLDLNPRSRHHFSLILLYSHDVRPGSLGRITILAHFIELFVTLLNINL